MKIGILTLTYKNNLNYGAALQAWALKTVIEKHTNHSAVVLPMEPEFSHKIRTEFLGKKRLDLRTKKNLRNTKEATQDQQKIQKARKLR